MGSCQGRQAVVSPKGASVEGWRLSQLPPLCPQPQGWPWGPAEDRSAREKGTRRTDTLLAPH